MRSAIIGCLLLLSTPAVAGPCEVTISRAPDDVRATIEGWVHAEPTCATTADVRVVATDGGYYLIAIDGNGRVHERVVPDGQSAGVLVASWIADDGSSGPVAAPEPPVVIATAPTPAPSPPSEAEADDLIAPLAMVHAAPSVARARTLAVGPTLELQDYGQAGLRVELDSRPRGGWTFGAAVAGTSSEPMMSADASYTLRAVVDVAHSSTRGRWSLRLAAGAGALEARYADPWGGSLGVLNAVIEGSALVSRDLHGGWAILGGPLLSVIAADQRNPRGNLAVFAGVRHPL